jgi:hypothetical protein
MLGKWVCRTCACSLFYAWGGISHFRLRCNSGMAGGTLPQHAGPGEAVFANNTFASMGDLGSKVLKPAPSGTVWTAGTSVKVSWGIRYNVRAHLVYCCLCALPIAYHGRCSCCRCCCCDLLRVGLHALPAARRPVAARRWLRVSNSISLAKCVPVKHYKSISWP